MLWQKVWREWRHGIGRTTRRIRRRPSPTRACVAEVLEDRSLLSVITVTTLADNTTGDGQVTLREAIQAANTNLPVDGSAAGDSATQDQIVFADGLTGTIELDSTLGPLSITQTVAITGLGAKDTAVDAQQNSRVFLISSTAGDVAFDALTIEGGKTTASYDGGAAIRFLSAGTLTITNSAISGNTTTGFHARGGAIYTDTGAVKLQNSLLSGNTTTGTAGHGIAIYSKNAPLTLINSTVSGNTASGYHGGGSIYTVGGLGSLTLTNTTVTQNFGVGNLDVMSGGISIVRGAVTLSNSIVSGNFDQDGRELDIDTSGYANPNTFTIHHSLVGYGVNRFTPLPPSPVGQPDANGNFIGTAANPIDAMLMPLADNGGPTMTHAILAGSPVIDAGDNSLAIGLDGSPLTTDQRGLGFPRIDHVIVDMGAFEGHFPDYPAPPVNTPLVVTTANDELDSNLSNPNDLSLREAIAIANSTFGADTIMFDPSLKDVPINLTLGQLTITDDLTIEGLGAKHTVIDAQGNSRVFEIKQSGSDLTLDGVTVTGGKTTAANETGAGVRLRWSGTLTIENSSISGNTTTGSAARGAGIFAYGGKVIVFDSLISGNTTTGSGGDGAGIYVNRASLLIDNSTVSDNTTAGYHADGAGIYSEGHEGSVTLTNATITANSAIGTEEGGSGGIVVLRGAVTFRNSIISGNFNRDGSEVDLSISEYADPSGFSSSHSLIGYGTNRNVALPPAPVGHPDANGNLIGTLAEPIDAKLLPLADYGGETMMHVTIAGSPAIDAGDNSLAVDPDGNPLAFDQRGPEFTRILWGTVDMGAFEAYENTPAAPLPRLVALEGEYYANGKIAQVLRVGDTLTFIDGDGRTSTGQVIDDTHVSATDWGLTARLFPQSGGLVFSDGTIWAKVRQLQGQWFNGQGGVVGINQLGTDLVFTNLAGQQTTGAFVDSLTVSAPGWGVTGQLSWDGQTINWSNGRAWTLIPNMQGDWVNGSGSPLRIEQLGSNVLFVNRVGQTSIGTFISPTQVQTGANWGSIVGTLSGQSIQWSNGTTWTTAPVTGDNPDLGGLWENASANDVRVLQADDVLTFVNRLGGTSAGHFISPTQVMADDWNVAGTVTNGQIAWDNATVWSLVPRLAGPYLDQTNHETAITQLERSLVFVDQANVVTHGTIVDQTHIVETDGPQRTATLLGDTVQWSDATVWTKLPRLVGDWSVQSTGKPTFIEQSGLTILIVGPDGTHFHGSFTSPTTAEVTQDGVPSPPVINVGITGDDQLDFGGATWNKSLVNNLDAYFASPNAWPFV